MAEVTAADAEGWEAGIPAGATEGTAGAAEKATKSGRRCANYSRRRPR